MLERELHVDVGDKRILLTPSGELEIPACYRKRAVPLPPSDGSYMLDAMFYENYYRYMDQALSPGGDGIGIVQVLCIGLPKFCHDRRVIVYEN